jgi:hypothetical protein
VSPNPERPLGMSTPKPESIRQQTGRLPHAYGQPIGASPMGQRAEGADNVTSGHVLALLISWTAVTLPLAWGVSETLVKTFALFK